MICLASVQLCRISKSLKKKQLLSLRNSWRQQTRWQTGSRPAIPGHQTLFDHWHTYKHSPLKIFFHGDSKVDKDFFFLLKWILLCQFKPKLSYCENLFFYGKSSPLWRQRHIARTLRQCWNYCDVIFCFIMFYTSWRMSANVRIEIVVNKSDYSDIWEHGDFSNDLTFTT